MYKAYKFRIYPSNEQLELINKSFGCERFVYNYYLNKIKSTKYIRAIDNINDYVDNLKYAHPFLTEIDSTIIRKSLFHLDDNLKRCYKNKFGFPKYKSKYDKNSYTTSAVYKSYKTNNYCNIEIDLDKKMIKLPKLKWVKIRGYRNLSEINGRIINATISRDINKKYYVSVMYEIANNKEMVNPTNIVGIDVGVKTLLTLSDGKIYENNKYIAKYEKRIKRLQRELARKEKRSINYYKCKEKIKVLYSKLKNARKYYIHKITKDITDEYDEIVCENLNTKNMIMKKDLSKEISDASFSEIIRQLEYKSKLKNKYFNKIDRYYASSQECSRCGHIDKEYKNLSKRIYKCTKCGNNLDRDLNASVNIMFEGLKNVYATIAN